MKKLLLIVFCLALTKAIHAQADVGGDASQNVQLGLANVISITYIGSEATVNLPFASASDYANGITSGTQDFLVQSNKQFKVTVKASSSRFSYTGSSTDPHMPISLLKIAVTANNTGGTIPNKFDNQFSKIKTSNQTIIKNGVAGGNQTFSVQYQADPGYSYPEGIYTATIVYTATQS